MKNLSQSNRTLVIATALLWVIQLFYVVMPLDLIPDLIPLLGWFDDLIGLSGALGMTAFTAKRLYEAGHLPQLQTEPTHETYEPIDPLELKAL